MDSGDGYTVWMDLKSLNCTLKMIKMVNFVMYVNSKKFLNQDKMSLCG